jgi:hypothetical protein
MFPFIFIVSTVYAQIEINLSGTIVNQADFPVKSMAVVLVKEGFSDTSDSDGKFAIIETTPISNSYPIYKPNLKFKGANFVLIIADGRIPVSLDIYNLKGAVVASVMKNKVLSKGEHIIPLFKKISSLSSSVLIATVKHGSDIYYFRLVKTGGSRFTIRDFTDNTLNSSQSYQMSYKPPELDSLRFIRKVIVQGQEQVIQEYSFPIDKWIDEFEVTLDLIPYDAVNFGVQEFNAGRIWPDEVGTELTEYPNAIKNYLDKTGPGPHDYEWWCSEYYSYALRVGECPLYSSSSNPDWMIDGNTILRSWFRNNSEYVERSSIGNFRPLPGDFCHIEGHAAMVWYIDDNDSLYTVEANGDLNGDGTFDNQMALVNRGPYKNFKDLLGYGKRTGFVGSSHKSISR